MSEKRSRDKIEPIAKSRRTWAWAAKHPEEFKRSRQRADSRKRAAMKELVRKFKSCPCADCGVQYPYYVMHCDHRPEEVKMFDVSRASTVELLELELRKCDPVCANCHAERTHQRKIAELVHAMVAKPA